MWDGDGGGPRVSLLLAAPAASPEGEEGRGAEEIGARAEGRLLGAAAVHLRELGERSDCWIRSTILPSSILAQSNMLAS